jgi:hypothetical protein
MSEWITDRLPTEEDGNFYCKVWVTYKNGDVGQEHWSDVALSKPWQRIIDKPAPYVKLERWTVQWSVDKFCLIDHRQQRYYSVGLGELGRNDGDAAQRIANLFNEVMP